MKQFEIRLRLKEPDPRLKSGMSAMANVATDRLERQLMLPAKAVFQKAGRQVVYARSGLGWEERSIVTGRRNAESVLVTSGIVEGDRVALQDPMPVPEEGASDEEAPAARRRAEHPDRGCQRVGTAGVAPGPGDLPTVRVVRGNLDLSVHTTGELRSGKSAMVVAPSVAGTLQIVRLAPAGANLKPNDVVVEFDPSEQEFSLEQSRSELEQAEQELVRSKAESDVQAAQDQVALLKARFAVRRAELDLGARELLGAVDVRKKELTLEESQRRLVQLEQDVKSKGTSSRAGLAVLEARRDKASLAMATARQNIENMTVRTPIEGVVVLKQNADASGGMYFSGMSLPEYRVGDMVWTGRMIAEVLDVRGLELQAKVNEADRANLSVGQAADVRVDGLPAGVFAGTITSISGAAARGFFFDNDSRRKFDTTLQIAKLTSGCGPGCRPTW